MRLSAVLMALIISIYVTGCVVQPKTLDLQREESNIYPDPIPDKALVYFYQVVNEKHVGNVKWPIHDGEKEIGGIGGRSYFYYYAKPGEHRFWSRENSDISELTIRLEPNETYYISVDIKSHGYVVVPRLTVEHSLEGESRVRQLHYATLVNDK